MDCSGVCRTCACSGNLRRTWMRTHFFASFQEPKNALTKQYHKLFELDGVELDFEDEALRVMARKSMERKTGARGLRAIMESTLMGLCIRLRLTIPFVNALLQKKL